MLSPDVDEAKSFLRQLAGSADAVVTFQTFYDDKNRKRRSLAQVHHGTLDEHADRLTALQQEGAGVFVMVNEGDGVKQQGCASCRTAANVQRVRALFVDLDGSPIEPVEASQVPPDIIVVSSPGRYHAYWVNVECPLEEFETAQWSLAKRFGGVTAHSETSFPLR